MSNNVTLSLPLSATALRLGATFLTDLAAQADVISREHIIGYAHTAGRAEVSAEGTYILEKGERVTSQTSNAIEQYVTGAETEVNVYDPAGALAEAVAVDPAREPAITQETLPPVEYETVVTGHAAGPVPFAEGHDQASYEDAGWTIQAMLDAGHLVEVTEQRPLAVAPGASAAPSAPAPAPAPAAPAATGVVVDKDGLPWDSRIHSDAAEKMSKTGYWKTRRNLPEGYKEEIEAQLRQVMSAGKPEASATTTTVAVAAPPAPSAPAAPAPAPAPGASTAAPSPSNPFADFTRWIVSHKLSATDVVLEVQKLGLTSIPDLGKRHDLIPAVVKALQDKGLGL